MPCRARKSVTTAISGGADISEVPGCHLFQEVSLQGGSLVSHELTVYLSVYSLFLTQ